MIGRQPSRHRPIESAGVLGRVKAHASDGRGLDSPCALPLFRSCRCRVQSRDVPAPGASGQWDSQEKARRQSRPIIGSDMRLTRITVRPDVCTGKPCIRDLRFPVSRLLGLLAARQTPDQILTAYPYLEAADIDEALRYAASLAEDETIEFGG